MQAQYIERKVVTQMRFTVAVDFRMGPEHVGEKRRVASHVAQDEQGRTDFSHRSLRSIPCACSSTATLQYCNPVLSCPVAQTLIYNASAERPIQSCGTDIDQ